MDLLPNPHPGCFPKQVFVYGRQGRGAGGPGGQDCRDTKSVGKEMWFHSFIVNNSPGQGRKPCV